MIKDLSRAVILICVLTSGCLLGIQRFVTVYSFYVIQSINRLYITVVALTCGWSD